MEALYIWLGVSRDGDEGLLFGPGATPQGYGHVPIMSTKPDEIQIAKPMAEKQIADYAKEGVFLELKLATFVRQQDGLSEMASAARTTQ